VVDKLSKDEDVSLGLVIINAFQGLT
jgi:hypothetical protein